MSSADDKNLNKYTQHDNSIEATFYR